MHSLGPEQCPVVQVALPLPVYQTYSYSVPHLWKNDIHIGARCICSFRHKKYLGVIVAVQETPETSLYLSPRSSDLENFTLPPKKKENGYALKPIELILKGPCISPSLLRFLIELASYYYAPLGEVIRLALPPQEIDTLKALVEDKSLHLFSKKMMGISKRVGGVGKRATKKLFSESVSRDDPPELSNEQKQASLTIAEALQGQTAERFLLYGVTGSGKTEVYFNAIDLALRLNQGALVLVPEIALTPQLVTRFRARFGDNVSVLHSKLTPKERYVMWQRLQEKSVHVAIGTRSALFAPIANLGLIVVDEEHDSSFKQEEGVRYHARDMALLRAQKEGAVAVLGSATPSLESMYLASQGKLKRLFLRGRPTSHSLPNIELVDLRRTGPYHAKGGGGGGKSLSIILHKAISETLEKKEQVILFLNRRGFSPSIRCQSCGLLAICPHCSIALTHHKKNHGKQESARCHHCDYHSWFPSRCKSCSSTQFLLEGIGTEKLEETLSSAFPESRIERLDRDSLSQGGKKKMATILDRMRERKIDILVGTQMVTKGHDLPYVSLVGVINADAALSLPDFRAGERGFQLLVQVAGRAGRGDVPGRVILQSYDVEHPAIRFAAKHDVMGFLEVETADRKELLYPPFSKLALLRLDGVDEEKVKRAAAELTLHLRANQLPEVDVVGPSVAPIERLRGRFRMRILLRGKERRSVREIIRKCWPLRIKESGVRMMIDVDPIHFL